MLQPTNLDNVELLQEKAGQHKGVDFVADLLQLTLHKVTQILHLAHVIRGNLNPFC